MAAQEIVDLKKSQTGLERWPTYNAPSDITRDFPIQSRKATASKASLTSHENFADIENLKNNDLRPNRRAVTGLMIYFSIALVIMRGAML
jgi:hypothetical protein